MHDMELILQLTVYAVSFTSGNIYLFTKICLFCLHANNKLVISFAFIGIADTPWRIFLQLLFLERVQTVH